MRRREFQPAQARVKDAASHPSHLCNRMTALCAVVRPVLVGHSMGGMVAQTALRRRPNAYRAAVLACTSPAFGSRTDEFQKKFVADRLAPLGAGKTMADLARTVVAAMGPNPDIAGRALASAAIAATPT